MFKLNSKLNENIESIDTEVKLKQRYAAREALAELDTLSKLLIKYNSITDIPKPAGKPTVTLNDEISIALFGEPCNVEIFIDPETLEPMWIGKK